MKSKTQLKMNSLEKRNLARHPMPRPTLKFLDKKKARAKNACRSKKDQI